MKYLDRIIDRYLQRLGYRKPVEIHVQPNTTTIDIHGFHSGMAGRRIQAHH